MIKAARIYDQDLIKAIMDHPVNLRAIRGDAKPGCDWPINDAIIYLGMFAEEIIGMFIGFARSEVVIEGHVAMHPDHYKSTDDCYKLALEWLEDSTSFKKLVGQTPIFNNLAIKCNERNGLEREGVNKKSYLMRGNLYDQVYFGRVLNGG